MRGKDIESSMPAARAWRRYLVAVSTALACAGLATVAGAQGLPGGIESPLLPTEATDALNTATEPGPYLKQQTGQDLDTDYTPIAKESKLWSLHQGARYDASGPEAEADYEGRFAASQNSAGEQVTTWDDELTDVAFSNTRNGFAGGQRKLDCVAADGSPGTDGVPDTYVPVIYRYGESSTGLRWLKPTEEKGGLIGDCSNPGFVGQIAWVRTTGMALAVGGDGSYPYRAPAYGKDVNGAPCAPDPNKPYGANCDQAGLGRAWLYNHGRWQALDFDPVNFRNRPDSASDPEGEDAKWGNVLHGMTALEFSPLPGRDFGFVGALGQIRPFLIAVKGQNGACEATDANECVSFPNEGALPVLGSGVSGRFDMDSREGPDGLTDDPPPPTVTVGEPGLSETLLFQTVPVPTPTLNGTSADASKTEEWATGGDTDHAFRFRFRVRQLRMDVNDSGTTLGTVAVTDGCCAGDPSVAASGGAQLGPAGNYPSILLFDDLGGRTPGSHIAGGEGWRWQLWSADPYSQSYERPAYYPFPEEQRRALPPPYSRPDWPDSFFATGVRFRTAPGVKTRISVIASPGGPPSLTGVPERTSIVSEPLCLQEDVFSTGNPALFGLTLLDRTQPGQIFSALRTQLASVRLVDGDGDELVALPGLIRDGYSPGAPPWGGSPSNAQRNTTGATCGQGAESRTRNSDGSAPPGDSVPDWAVGELRSTHRPGLGSRGLAFSTVSRPTLVPEVLDFGWTGDEPAGPGGVRTIDPARVTATLADPVNNPPTRQEKLVAYLQSQHFFTGSYALNAIDYLDGTSSGWAVGRHGGIVQLGGGEGSLASKAKVEPEPPPLGAKRPGQAPERAPYEPFDPPASAPGAVPPLGTRPPERLAQPALRFAGTPNASRDYGNRKNELGQLIMSRDGSEGWGLDYRKESFGHVAMTLFRYQGGAWSRCDPEGIDGVTRPDPACAALAPLRSYSEGGKTKGVTIAAAARIPYENDADAANDDEFELFALGTGYRNSETEEVRPAMLRYREGAWRVDEDSELRGFFTNTRPNGGFASSGVFPSGLALAFASPIEGWAVARRPSSGFGDRLLRFDGERWIDCMTSLDGDPKQTSDVSDSKGRLVPNDPETRKQWCDDDDQLTISATEATTVPSAGFTGETRVQDIDSFAGLTTAGSRLYLYGSRTVGGESYPLVLCKEPEGDWRSAGCGLDPGLKIREGEASDGLTGQVNALSVAVERDGSQRGWAVGGFGGGAALNARAGGFDLNDLASGDAGLIASRPDTSLLRLGDEGWKPFADAGPIRDRYGFYGLSGLTALSRPIALPGGGGLIWANGAPLRFERDIGQWRYLPADLVPSHSAGDGHGSSRGPLVAVAPDNQGGEWLGLKAFASDPFDLVHYTDSPTKPVLSEAPSPLPRKEESFTALAGQPNGTLWASTSDGSLYRYARTTGWDRVPIPGWRAARATIAPAAYAIAVNASGAGVVVGREGRIAGISGSEVRLDPAAGTLCDLTSIVPPCGTSRHLRAAAVASDGAAIVGGENLSLLWRPAGGQFRAVEKPEAASSAEVTGLSLPSANVAFLVTNQGQLFRGVFDGVKWSWQLEGADASGSLLTLDPTSSRPPAALRAVAVDSSGHGYAAGARGVLLERTGEGAVPWRMIRSGVSDTLTAIVLRGEHALIGGAEGLVLTGSGERFAIARAADQYGDLTGNVVGLALSGGLKEGQTEAWAASDGPGARSGRVPSVSQLFHYASDESEPLLNPQAARASTLADSPAAHSGELSFAALGKADCHRSHALCAGIGAVGAQYAALSRKSVEAIAARTQRPNGPALTVFTGDIADDAGLAATSTIEGASLPPVVRAQIGRANLVGAAKLRAARTWLAEPLARGGLPFFSAIGSQDLATSQLCPGAGNPGLNASDSCQPTQELARPGLNDVWREAFATEPAPWGKGKRFASERYEVRPLSGSGSQLYLPEPELDAAGTPVEPKLVSGGARTHYAFDLVERETGRKLARFAFADNSLRSLAASDPIQHPTELEANEGGSGQAGWLRRVLCVKGGGSRCSREPGQPAIVVANAPTYSYANGDPRFWAKDAAVFESLLLQNDATAVISGSLGWNGRYWATAPGLHEPCQGEDYRDDPPRPGTSSCRGRSTEELPLGAGGVAPAANGLASALGPAGPPLQDAQHELSSVTGSGLLPFVVASGAGGKLAGQDPGQGFFHGYTIVRVPGDANPAGVLVEQRPLYDFLSITAASHVLRPGQKMTLRGVGHGPLVYDPSSTSFTPRSTSFDPIDSAAIGHRYDLVEADPKRPWLPRRVGGGQDPSTAASPGGDASAQDDKEDGYVPLDPSVATIDSETGAIAVGKGNNPRAFAIGMLSVGCSGTQAGSDGACDPSDPGVHSATFPLLFESRRTFKPVVVATPRVAQIKARAQAALPQPPNPPSPPAVKGVDLPAPPGVPVPPPVNVPNVQPPAPPIPPPPPVGQSPVPLDLSASAPSVTIAPQTTVIPPPAPPIQPAPPGGARREARQRQSATQSSGSGSGANEGNSNVDLADSPRAPEGSAMTRRTTHEFTATARSRAEGGSMTAYYGVSVTLLAIVAAFGWNYGRPGPRRRSPVEPAPARAWARRRW